MNSLDKFSSLPGTKLKTGDIIKSADIHTDKDGTYIFITVENGTTFRKMFTFPGESFIRLVYNYCQILMIDERDSIPNYSDNTNFPYIEVGNPAHIKMEIHSN